MKNYLIFINKIKNNNTKLLISSGIAVSMFLLLIFINSPKQSSSTQQLIDKCPANNKNITTKLGSSTGSNKKDEIMITSTDYVFSLPVSDWKIVTSLAEQFEESIRYPKVKHSIFFSYPEPNKYPMFIDEKNVVLVSFTISDDLCNSVEEWISKLDNIDTYERSYPIFNKNKWLFAENKTTLPVHQMAIIHKDGYHYEFNFYARDIKQFLKYKNTLTDTLKSMKFF